MWTYNEDGTMNCSRTKVISTTICLFVFCGYLFIEFHSRRLVTIETTIASNQSQEKFQLRHELSVRGEDNPLSSGADDASQLRTRVGEQDVWDYVENIVDRSKFVDNSEKLIDTVNNPVGNVEKSAANAETLSDTAEKQIDTAEKAAESAGKAVDTAGKGGDTVGSDAGEALRQVQEKERQVQQLLDAQRHAQVNSSSSGGTSPNSAVVVRPFVPDKPKMILLLAQQRVGSTFIGGIFDKNTNAIYIYEPLEGVYTHMYGTAKGWAVPLDIHFHWNRTYRALPPYEQRAVAHLIEQIFTCDYSNMISEYLVHEFWWSFRQTQAVPYTNCIKQLKVSVNACQTKIKSVCESRVGQNLKKEKYCLEQLKAVFSGQPAADPFKQYKTCMDEQRRKVIGKCVPLIQGICTSKPLHVIKTVRMDLETILPLMDRHPNMRVIHLIRDPRSVVLSRVKSGWSTQGGTNLKDARGSLKNTKGAIGTPQHVNGSIDFEHFSLGEELRNSPAPPNGVAREAQMYCSLTRKDIITRRYLEDKYPGSTYQMIYDHMVSHPVHELERIYEFIDEPIPKSISQWVGSLNSGAKTSQSIASKWRKEMSVPTAKQVDTYCQNLYDTIDFTWPDP